MGSIFRQLAGYARHRGAYQRGGIECLLDELQLDLDRLPTRNLSRDDRDHLLSRSRIQISLSRPDFRLLPLLLACIGQVRSVARWWGQGTSSGCGVKAGPGQD